MAVITIRVESSSPCFFSSATMHQLRRRRTGRSAGPRWCAGGIQKSATRQLLAPQLLVHRQPHHYLSDSSPGHFPLVDRVIPLLGNQGRPPRLVVYGDVTPGMLPTRAARGTAQTKRHDRPRDPRRPLLSGAGLAHRVFQQPPDLSPRSSATSDFLPAERR